MDVRFGLFCRISKIRLLIELKMPHIKKPFRLQPFLLKAYFLSFKLSVRSDPKECLPPKHSKYLRGSKNPEVLQQNFNCHWFSKGLTYFFCFLYCCCLLFFNSLVSKSSSSSHMSTSIPNTYEQISPTSNTSTGTTSKALTSLATMSVAVRDETTVPEGGLSKNVSDRIETLSPHKLLPSKQHNKQNGGNNGAKGTRKKTEPQTTQKGCRCKHSKCLKQ